MYDTVSVLLHHRPPLLQALPSPILAQGPSLLQKDTGEKPQLAFSRAACATLVAGAAPLALFQAKDRCFVRIGIKGAWQDDVLYWFADLLLQAAAQ